MGTITIRKQMREASFFNIFDFSMIDKFPFLCRCNYNFSIVIRLFLGYYLFGDNITHPISLICLLIKCFQYCIEVIISTVIYIIKLTHMTLLIVTIITTWK